MPPSRGEAKRILGRRVTRRRGEFVPGHLNDNFSEVFLLQMAERYAGVPVRAASSMNQRAVEGQAKKVGKLVKRFDLLCT